MPGGCRVDASHCWSHHHWPPTVQHTTGRVNRLVYYEENGKNKKNDISGKNIIHRLQVDNIILDTRSYGISNPTFFLLIIFSYYAFGHFWRKTTFLVEEDNFEIQQATFSVDAHFFADFGPPTLSDQLWSKGS
jgi:hypothetical protein